MSIKRTWIALILWVSFVLPLAQVHAQPISISIPRAVSSTPGRSLPSNYIAWSPNGRKLATLGGTADDLILLWDLASQQLTTLKGHTGWISGIAWSPDGQTLASAGSDNMVRLWDMSGTLLATLTGHTGAITSLMWSPDGSQLVTAASNDDATIRLWTASGQPVLTIPNAGPSRIDGGTRVLWSPDGQRLSALYGDGTAEVFNPNGKRLATFSERQDKNSPLGTINSIAWSPDSQLLALAAAQGIELWNANGQRLATFANTGGAVNLEWSPDGTTLAVIAQAGMQLWRIEGTNGRLISTQPGSVTELTDLKWSPDGKILAAATRRRLEAIQLWDVAGGSLVSIPSGEEIQGGLFVAWSPDGKSLASWMYGGAQVRVVDTRGKVLATLNDPNAENSPAPASTNPQISPNPAGHQDSITAVAWHNNRLASASLDKTVRIWTGAGKLLATLSHPAPVSQVAWSSDGKLLATGAEDNLLRLWRADGSLLKTFSGASARGFRNIRWLSDQRLATTSLDSVVQLWDISQGVLLASLPNPPHVYVAPVWSPDGSTLAYVQDIPNQGPTLQLWNNQGAVIADLAGKTEGIGKLLWSPDSSLLAAEQGEDILIWGADGKLRLSIPHGASMVDNGLLAWSPDSTRFAFGANLSADNAMVVKSDAGEASVQIWGLSGKQTATFIAGQTHLESSLAWSPDSQSLVTAVGDGSIRLWSATGQPIITLQEPQSGVLDRYAFLQWSPDGATLAIASNDTHTLKLWNVQAQRMTTIPMPAESAMIFDLAWSGDSQEVAISFGGGPVWLFSATGKPLASLSADW